MSKLPEAKTLAQKLSLEALTRIGAILQIMQYNLDIECNPRTGITKGMTANWFAMMPLEEMISRLQVAIVDQVFWDQFSTILKMPPFLQSAEGSIERALLEKTLNGLLLTEPVLVEANHVHARTTYNIRTIIPPTIGRQSMAMPRTKYRRLMRTHWPKQLYGQRWQVETVMSMLKRNFGSALRARSYWGQCREIMLRLFSHNVMIALSG